MLSESVTIDKNIFSFQQKNIPLKDWIGDVFVLFIEVPETFNYFPQMNGSNLARRFYFDVETQMVINFNSRIGKNL